ncbi:uncharacterized protein JCM6883_002982 [Sporobolomyces salmoneus]|uniref:uncharacterized protein n=1 Tax=Sporobolomyces salmoneus TaxID=183962 RepID=UPI00317A644F
MGLRPPLEEGVLPPTDYPHGRSTSPYPLRPLHARLVDPQLGPSSTSWTLTLTEALQSGAHHFSQVWRAQASPAGDPSSTFPVVVKLYQQSLFPPRKGYASNPIADSWNWRSAEYLQERESLVYR